MGTYSAPVTVRKIQHPIPPAQVVVVSFVDDETSHSHQLEDVLLLLKHVYSGKYVQVGSILNVPYYGRRVRFMVQEVRTLPHMQISPNSPSHLETITEGLQHMSFGETKTDGEAVCSTPVRPHQQQNTTPHRIPIHFDYPQQTPVRNLVRNMLEDSYAASSTEESQEELSQTIDSFSDSPIKDVFNTSLRFHHVVNSCEWQIMAVKKPSNENTSKENLISLIGGLQNVIDEVREIMSLALGPSRTWKHGLKISRGLLLFGPSGTGKTVLAHGLAQDSKASVHILQGSELFSKVLGETDSRLRSFFSKATSAGPSVILLDEIDSLCSKKANASGGSEVERRVITTLCTILDSLSSGNKRVFVIATSSRPDSVESSLRRPGR